MIQQTDGRGIVTNYTYDELERVSQKLFPASATENVTYTYDNCLLGTGYLCRVDDESGNYNYQYDAFGNVVQMEKTELGQTYTTQYQYDDGDNISQMTYPTGRILTIQRDGIRRIQAMDATVNGSQQSIVSNIQYRSDHQMTQCTFGNGTVDARSYDMQGRLTAQLLADGPTDIDERVYSYDRNSNMLSRTTTPQNSQYQYDKLDRITHDQIDGNTAFQLDYDLNHNRTHKNQPDQTPLTENYLYQPGTNRLSVLETAEITTGSSSIDPKPNQTSTYNNANRWFQLFEEGELKATYILNAMGQRTRKVTAQGTTIYHYDLNGSLIAETSEAGELQRDYIWAGMAPVAQIDRQAGNDGNDIIYYLHTDHLYTPRFATGQGRDIIWRWEGDAFGEAEADQDPDGDTEETVINLRFPGQYFDEETNTHYNYFRDYDPGIGRYIQSDPIGLRGGMNTYNYAASNSLLNIDPLGLAYSPQGEHGLPRDKVMNLPDGEDPCGCFAQAFGWGNGGGGRGSSFGGACCSLFTNRCRGWLFYWGDVCCFFNSFTYVSSTITHENSHSHCGKSQSRYQGGW